MENQVPKPQDNMIWAILSTICCCLPLGIVAIINASKVDGLYRNGDYAEAQRAADNAKKYSLYGAYIAAAGFVIYMLVLLFGIALNA